MALTRLVGFTLEPRALVGPSAIMGPILDMVVVSHDVEGMSYEELGWHVNLSLLRLFIVPARARRRSIKLAITPTRNLRPLA
jgi:hypothetical protein